MEVDGQSLRATPNSPSILHRLPSSRHTLLRPDRLTSTRDKCHRETCHSTQICNPKIPSTGEPLQQARLSSQGTSPKDNSCNNSMKRPPQHVARLPRRTLRNLPLAKTIVLMTGNPTGNHLNDFKDLLHGDRCSRPESMLRHMWSSTAFAMMLTFVRLCSLYDNDALSACLAFSSNVMQSSKKRYLPWILFFFFFSVFHHQ